MKFLQKNINSVCAQYEMYNIPLIPIFLQDYLIFTVKILSSKVYYQDEHLTVENNGTIVKNNLKKEVLLNLVNKN